MTWVEQIAHYRGRRDEVPNVELAVKLASARNRAAIRELAGHLRDPDHRVAADCLKVLYEVAERDPALVAPWVAQFLDLLGSRNNRMIWGAMTSLSALAPVCPEAIYPQRRRILAAMKHGSVITVDRGVLALARLAVARPAWRRTLVPLLLRHLETCRPKDVAQHAESIAPAIGPGARRRFFAVLERRARGVSASGQARIRRILRRLSQAAAPG